MSTFRIVQFEGKPEIACRDADELSQFLSSLNKRGFSVPTLVNVYDEMGRIAIVGLGSDRATVQLVDKSQGETHRSTASNQNQGSSIEFSYQGEATFVGPRFLIPVDCAIQSVVLWLA